MPLDVSVERLGVPFSQLIREKPIFTDSREAERGVDHGQAGRASVRHWRGLRYQ